MIKSSEDTSKTFSPCDLVDFMINRATEEPIAFCILIELRFAEVIFMLHQSEKESQSNLFMSCLRFLLPLYASSHATKYVSMVTDFLVEWHCMSAAEKIVWAKGVLTRETKNGSMVFTDRFVEWMMRDMRMWLGKHSSLHHDKLVEQTALMLNDMKIDKGVTAKKRRKNSDNGVKELSINKFYCESLIYFLDTILWGPGDIITKEKSSDTNFKEGSNRGGFPDRFGREQQVVFQSFTGVPLNTDILFLVSTGTKRSQKYYDVYKVKGDLNEASRSENEEEGGVSLKQIDPTLFSEEQKQQLHEKRIKILDPLEIEALYSSDEIKKEYKFLNAELEKLGLPIPKRDTRVYKNWNKRAYAHCISTARLTLLDHDKKWIDNRLKNINDTYEQESISKHEGFMENVKAELRNDFFSFKETKTYKNFKDDNKQYCFVSSTAENNNNKSIIIDTDKGDNKKYRTEANETSKKKSRISLGVTHFPLHEFEKNFPEKA